MNDFYKPQVEISAEDFLQQFTDPSLHNSDNFCYLIHAINPSAESMQVTAMFSFGKYDNRKHIRLLHEPYRISEKPQISCSVITESHTERWGPNFFILKPKWKLFKSMSERDIGNHFMSAQTKGVDDPDWNPHKTPRGLCSTSEGYNEVVIYGKAGVEKAEIAGIGIEVYPDGTFVHASSAGDLIECALKLDVPIIYLNREFKQSMLPVHIDRINGEMNFIVIEVAKGFFRINFNREIGTYDIFTLQQINGIVSHPSKVEFEEAIVKLAGHLEIEEVQHIISDFQIYNEKKLPMIISGGFDQARYRTYASVADTNNEIIFSQQSNTPYLDLSKTDFRTIFRATSSEDVAYYLIYDSHDKSLTVSHSIGRYTLERRGHNQFRDTFREQLPNITEKFLRILKHFQTQDGSSEVIVEQLELCLQKLEDFVNE